MMKLKDKKNHYIWFSIIMKILYAIPQLIDFKIQTMKAGPKCGMRFFDGYADDF